MTSLPLLLVALGGFIAVGQTEESGSGTAIVIAASATSPTPCGRLRRTQKSITDVNETDAAKKPRPPPICYATLRVCKNTQVPSIGGSCTTFGATSTVSGRFSKLAYAFEGKHVLTGVTCPGTCVVSVRVATFFMGIPLGGRQTADIPMVFSSSGVHTVTITALGGDGNLYSVPINLIIICDGDEGEGENGETETELDK